MRCIWRWETRRVDRRGRGRARRRLRRIQREGTVGKRKLHESIAGYVRTLKGEGQFSSSRGAKEKEDEDEVGSLTNPLNELKMHAVLRSTRIAARSVSAASWSARAVVAAPSIAPQAPLRLQCVPVLADLWDGSEEAHQEAGRVAGSAEANRGRGEGPAGSRGAGERGELQGWRGWQRLQGQWYSSTRPSTNHADPYVVQNSPFPHLLPLRQLSHHLHH